MDRRARVGVLTFLLALGVSADASAQDELEPNNTCALAQELGTVEAFPGVFGSLSELDAASTSDVDFFALSGTPGTSVTVFSPFAGDVLYGLFDEQCHRFEVEPAGRQLDFPMPASGRVVLGVASASDPEFAGVGSSNFGSYELFAEPTAPYIGSVSGRLIDASTGEPIVRGLARLQICDAEGCSFVGRALSDEQGRFRIDGDLFRRRFFVGRYRLVGDAFDRQTGVSPELDVAENEDREFGDLPLALVPFAISDVQPCPDIPREGGTCRYSVRIQNRTEASLSVLARSVVDDGGGQPVFEASTRPSDPDVTRAALTLPPLGSSEVTFSFDVPAGGLGGMFLCPNLQVGIGARALFAPDRRQDFLFCLWL